MWHTPKPKKPMTRAVTPKKPRMTAVCRGDASGMARLEMTVYVAMHIALAMARASPINTELALSSSLAITLLKSVLFRTVAAASTDAAWLSLIATMRTPSRHTMTDAVLRQENVSLPWGVTQRGYTTV